MISPSYEDTKIQSMSQRVLQLGYLHDVVHDAPPPELSLATNAALVKLAMAEANGPAWRGVKKVHD